MKIMNWLLNKLAYDKTYYAIFLSVLCAYALVSDFIFGLVVNYAPHQAGYVATFLLLMAAVIGFVGPIVHNLCREKMLGEKNDSNQSSV